MAASLANLGNAVYEQGDTSAAQTLFEESLTISRELGDRHLTAITLHRLGMLEGAKGNHRTAEGLYQKSLTVLRELGLRGRIFFSLGALATVAAALGNPLRAAGLWGAEERLREEVGLPRPPHETVDFDAQIRDARATVGDVTTFDLAKQEGHTLTLEQAIDLALIEPLERRGLSTGSVTLV